MAGEHQGGAEVSESIAQDLQPRVIRGPPYVDRDAVLPDELTEQQAMSILEEMLVEAQKNCYTPEDKMQNQRNAGRVLTMSDVLYVLERAGLEPPEEDSEKAMTDGGQEVGDVAQEIENDEDVSHTGRPKGAPTPPGSELIGDFRPSTTALSKRVMLDAERHDEVTITRALRGVTEVPEELTVIQRTDTYFGPKLMLHAEVDGEDQNWLLTCPGPQSQLILWKAVTGKHHQWRSSWIPVSEVRAKISGVEQYRICDHCGEPLRDLWHERLAVFGLCEGGDVNV
jgi:hypothetical protein